MIVYSKAQLDRLKQYVAQRKNDYAPNSEMGMLFYYLENLTDTSLAYYSVPFPSAMARVDKLFAEIEATLEEKSKATVR